MIQELISTVAKVTDASRPTETHKVLLKNITSYYNVELQEETITLNSYKVINDEDGEYEFIRTHARTIDKPTLDAIRASLTITSTDYTDVRNEELVKGAKKIFGTEGIFGFTEAQLTER